MKILALDWGEKRIGAAICDEGGKIAFPLGHPIDSKSALLEIKKIIKINKIEKILIGKPLTLSGASGTSATKVNEFAISLTKQTGLPLKFLDERFSSVEAGKILQGAGMSEKKQRQIKDNIAAQIMLQSYLDKQNLSR